MLLLFSIMLWLLPRVSRVVIPLWLDRRPISVWVWRTLQLGRWSKPTRLVIMAEDLVYL